ncbi:MAG: Hsp20/alpha crystallin family protein [Thermoplasmata archaeon]|nr:MAG: Hsp20/alpha crystallin family protein [Thermoplasmata archaeon]RLF36199.1 MAG: Hsp20/alpha crystallin family protein [Thermoplasmata archaeon]
MDPFKRDRDRRRRNPFDFFDIDDEDFEKIFEEARRIMEEIFREGISFKSFEPGKPIIHGFSIKIGPDGKPRVQEFGNKPMKTPAGEPMISEEREPLTDIIEGEEEVSITVEIPGVEKEDIDLNVTEDTVEINVDTPQRKYHKIIDLPCEVKPRTTKATYKNGVLDIVITRKEKKKTGGYKVDIQ